MSGILIFYSTSMIFLIIIYNLSLLKKSDIISVRKKQTEGLYKENVLRGKFDKVLKEKIRNTRRKNMEKKIHQAGFNIGFTDFIIISLVAGLVISFVFGGVLKNSYLGILFLLYGFIVPYQVIGVLRNKRLKLLEKQIGAFLHMTIKRYENTRNMHQALRMTGRELKGEEPIFTEINETVLEIQLGIPVDDALDNMAERTNNKFLKRFASYYRVVAVVGGDELRKNMLMQAYAQYVEDREMKRVLDEKIRGPVQDAKVLVVSVPGIVLFNAMTNPEYITFMTTTTMGKVGTAVIVGTLLAVMWFINAKIGAPLD